MNIKYSNSIIIEKIASKYQLDQETINKNIDRDIKPI